MSINPFGDAGMQRSLRRFLRSSVGATPVTPVAGIGMACRLPAGIDSPDQSWEALLRGDDLATATPFDRWDAGARRDSADIATIGAIRGSELLKLASANAAQPERV